MAERETLESYTFKDRDDSRADRGRLGILSVTDRCSGAVHIMKPGQRKTKIEMCEHNEHVRSGSEEDESVSVGRIVHGITYFLN